jgi:hypothetical protein
MEPTLSYYENRTRYYAAEYDAFRREYTSLRELHEDEMAPLQTALLYTWLLVGVALFFSHAFIIELFLSMQA